jgi:hypothetical protein
MKTHTSHHVATRPRNPRIPIALFVTQTAFRARMNIFKSGISGSGCYYLLNRLAKLLQKIIASHKNPAHRMLLSFVIILQSWTKSLKCPHGLGNFVIIWCNPVIVQKLDNRWDPAVGNSPLILDLNIDEFSEMEIRQCGDQKLRDFRPPYLRSEICIREY